MQAMWPSEKLIRVLTETRARVAVVWHMLRLQPSLAATDLNGFVLSHPNRHICGADRQVDAQHRAGGNTLKAARPGSRAGGGSDGSGGRKSSA